MADDAKMRELAIKKFKEMLGHESGSFDYDTGRNSSWLNPDWMPRSDFDEGNWAQTTSENYTSDPRHPTQRNKKKSK